MDWAPAMPFWRRSPKESAPWYRPRNSGATRQLGRRVVASQVACSEAMPYLKDVDAGRSHDLVTLRSGVRPPKPAALSLWGPGPAGESGGHRLDENPANAQLKDLTIELEEKAGTIPAVAEPWGRLASTSKASVGFVVGDKGVGHVLVADRKARQALQSAGARVISEPRGARRRDRGQARRPRQLTRKIADAASV